MLAANGTADTALRTRSEVRQYCAAYRTVFDIARHYRDEIVALRKCISEEMPLYYSGMLSSVVELLPEMVLDTMNGLKAYAELMRKIPGMEHDEPHMAHVAPGKSGEIGWRFTRTGTYYCACLIPGHFAAGMIGRITVTR